MRVAGGRAWLHGQSLCFFVAFSKAIFIKWRCGFHSRADTGKLRSCCLPGATKVCARNPCVLFSDVINLLSILFSRTLLKEQKRKHEEEMKRQETKFSEELAEILSPLQEDSSSSCARWKCDEQTVGLRSFADALAQKPAAVSSSSSSSSQLFGGSKSRMSASWVCLGVFFFFCSADIDFLFCGSMQFSDRAARILSSQVSVAKRLTDACSAALLASFPLSSSPVPSSSSSCPSSPAVTASTAAAALFACERAVNVIVMCYDRIAASPSAYSSSEQQQTADATQPLASLFPSICALHYHLIFSAPISSSSEEQKLQLAEMGERIESLYVLISHFLDVEKNRPHPSASAASSAAAEAWDSEVNAFACHHFMTACCGRVAATLSSSSMRSLPALCAPFFPASSSLPQLALFSSAAPSDSSSSSSLESNTALLDRFLQLTTPSLINRLLNVCLFV